MRTTMDLSEDLLRRAKKKATDEGIPLRDVVEAALRAYLTPARSAPYRFRWTTEKGKLLPGIDLDDRDALFDAMEGRKK